MQGRRIDVGGRLGLRVGRSERRSFDADGVAAVAQPIEKRTHCRLLSEQLGPVVVVEIGGDQSLLLSIPLFHQSEEDVASLGAEIEVAQLSDQVNVDADQALEEFSRRAIGQRRVHLRRTDPGP